MTSSKQYVTLWCNTSNPISKHVYWLFLSRKEHYPFCWILSQTERYFPNLSSTVFGCTILVYQSTTFKNLIMFELPFSGYWIYQWNINIIMPSRLPFILQLFQSNIQYKTFFSKVVVSNKRPNTSTKYMLTSKLRRLTNGNRSGYVLSITALNLIT